MLRMAPPQGLVTLSSASAGRLVDDMKSWPDEIRIDNFTYGSFEQGAPLTSKRLGWLRRQKEFSPQPYEQVLQVLRRMGYEKDARGIARAKQDDLKTKGKLGWPARLWLHIASGWIVTTVVVTGLTGLVKKG